MVNVKVGLKVESGRRKEVLVVLSEFGRRGASVLSLSLPRRQLQLWLHSPYRLVPDS